MFTRAEEVAEFVGHVQGRATVVLLLENVDAIEDLPKRYDDDVKEAATRTLENVQGQDQAALHILTVGNPAYRSAYRKVMRMERPDLALHFLEGEESAAMRASMALASSNGGYLLPFELDPTIILTNTGTSNQIRSISRVVQTTQNVYHLVASAGVNMEWTAEAAEATDASPTSHAADDHLLQGRRVRVGELRVPSGLEHRIPGSGCSSRTLRHAVKRPRSPPVTAPRSPRASSRRCRP